MLDDDEVTLDDTDDPEMRGGRNLPNQVAGLAGYRPPLHHAPPTGKLPVPTPEQLRDLAAPFTHTREETAP